MPLKFEVATVIIAPTFKQASFFCQQEGWNPRYVHVATEEKHLMGLRLEGWNVWWLDRMWPCRTHEDVAHMENMKSMAKLRGADLRRWWT